MKTKTAERSFQIDLGLAVLSAIAQPGQRFSQAEIASVCGCSKQAIESIERIALRKLHAQLRFLDASTASFVDAPAMERMRNWLDLNSRQSALPVTREVWE